MTQYNERSDDGSSDKILGKVPCEACGSQDNLVVYGDGHAHCFTPSCGTHFKPGSFDEGCNRIDESGNAVEPSAPSKKLTKKEEAPATKGGYLITNGVSLALATRGLTVETCRSWHYQVAKENGKYVQVANFFNDAGQVSCQKTRDEHKNFFIKGDSSQLSLWGKFKFKAGGCESLVITEGEIDAMTVDQVINGTSTSPSVAVVSLPNGAQSVVKAIKKDFAYVDSFKKIILCFDQDEAGREAVKLALAVLPMGKVYVAVLPGKDANALLLEDRVQDIQRSIKQANLFTPSGIIEGTKISVEDLKAVAVRGFPTPYPKLDEVTGGIRKGELVLLAAGTGVGKSTLAREIGYYLNVEQELSIGNLYLEEKYIKTAQGYVAIHNNIPLGDLRKDPTILSDEVYQDTLKAVISNDRTFFFDHFGSLESSALFSKLKYLAAHGVDFIILDHISIVISGMESSREGERKDIDIIMTNLRSLIEATGIGIIAICHLSKNNGGKSHEEGGRVTLDDLRGSASLKQIPDLIIAIERNQQSDTEADEADLRVLKNREFGNLGLADRIKYSKTTGRLLPIERTMVVEAVATYDSKKEREAKKNMDSKYSMDWAKVPDYKERQAKMIEELKQGKLGEDDDIPF